MPIGTETKGTVDTQENDYSEFQLKQGFMFEEVTFN